MLFVALVVPQFAQQTIFKLVMPYLRDGQTFVVLPGNFSSFIFKRMMEEAGINKKITFVDTTTIPHAVRVIGPGNIYILGKKTALSAASLPAAEINTALDNLKDVLFLKVIPLKNVLEAGFSNPNMIIHVATATLGMGPMESRQGRIQFYAEGCSPSVAKVLEKEDEERIAVGNAYGLKLMTFIESVIRIDNIYNDTDYFKEGLNLEKLGLAGNEQRANFGVCTIARKGVIEVKVAFFEEGWEVPIYEEKFKGTDIEVIKIP